MTPTHHYKQYRPLHRPYHRVGNPYFRSRRADRLGSGRLETSAARLSFKTWLYLLLSCIILVGLVWLLFFSHVLVIKNIKVIGTHDYKAESITEMAWRQTHDKYLWVLPETRLMAFSKGQLLEKINHDYIFSSISIKKKIPATLMIKVSEKPAAVYWFENDTYYLLDAEGWVLETQITPLTETVVIYNNAEPKINTRRLGEAERLLIAPAMKLQVLLQSRFSYLKAKQITVTQERNTLVVILEGGQLIYFDSRQSVETQLDRLDTLIKYEVKNRLPAINYIDLRFGDKVYYK